MNTTRATNPTDTTLAPKTCRYRGCDSIAVTTDAEGDDCCLDCAAKAEQWVVLTDLSESATWCTAEQAEALESAMRGLGWDVEIRQPRSSEAEGTYMRGSSGDLGRAVWFDPAQDAVEYFKAALDREWNKLIS